MINAILIKSNYTLKAIPQLVLFMAQVVLVIVHHMYVLTSGYE